MYLNQAKKKIPRGIRVTWHIIVIQGYRMEANNSRVRIELGQGHIYHTDKDTAAFGRGCIVDESANKWT